MADRAKLVIDLDGAGDLTLTIAGADVYPTRVSAVAETFPMTITTSYTCYVVTDPASVLTISMMVNGIEMGQHATVAKTFTTDGIYVIQPQWHKGYNVRIEDSDIYLGTPAVGATTAVHAAVTDTGAQQVVTTGITNPDTARNVTATAGGTAAAVGAIQVIVAGTNAAGEAITETLPAFTLSTPGTVTGNKAFKTVTSITIPAHTGTGATTAVGTGAKLGLPRKLQRNLVAAAFLNNAREGTAPTVATSASALESNTVTLNSTLDGTAVHISLF